MTFGEKIKQIRKDKDVSQEELADFVGINPTYISKIENHHLDPPSQEVIKLMAKKLEANADQLLLLANKVPDDVKEKIVNSDLNLLDLIRNY